LPAQSLYPAAFQHPQSQQQHHHHHQQQQLHFGLDVSGAPMMSGVMQPAPPMYTGNIPDMSVQMGLESDGYFALGNMLDDGLFSLPFDINPPPYG
jgi:hypothetical protein